MDQAWHDKHPLGRGSTQDERVRWHRAHQAACGCRPVPPSLKRLVSRA